MDSLYFERDHAIEDSDNSDVYPTHDHDNAENDAILRQKSSEPVPAQWFQHIGTYEMVRYPKCLLLN
jgi:hypothetical protein